MLAQAMGRKMLTPPLSKRSQSRVRSVRSSTAPENVRPLARRTEICSASKLSTPLEEGCCAAAAIAMIGKQRVDRQQATGDRRRKVSQMETTGRQVSRAVGRRRLVNMKSRTQWGGWAVMRLGGFASPMPPLDGQQAPAAQEGIWQ